MNLSPAFGFIGILYAIVVTGLSAYVLVQAIIFLRLRIAELRRATPPTSTPLR
jgi:tellurite resistance protein TehA-like permease